MINNSSDEELLKIAVKRARFQRHLVTYLVINAFLWIIWWFTSGDREANWGMPWPLWSMLGWGIGLVFQYMEAYGGSKGSLVNSEFEKLKKKRDQSI